MLTTWWFGHLWFSCSENCSFHINRRWRLGMARMRHNTEVPPNFLWTAMALIWLQCLITMVAEPLALLVLFGCSIVLMIASEYGPCHRERGWCRKADYGHIWCLGHDPHKCLINTSSHVYHTWKVQLPQIWYLVAWSIWSWLFLYFLNLWQHHTSTQRKRQYFHLCWSFATRFTTFW